MSYPAACAKDVSQPVLTNPFFFRTAIERAFDDAACAVNGRVSAVRTRRYSACDAMPRPQKALPTQYVIARSPLMEKAPAVPTSRSSRTIPKLEKSGENRSFARCALNGTRSSGSAAVNAAIRTASGSRIIPKTTSRSVSSTGRSFTIFISQTIFTSQTIRRAADASYYRRARKPDGQCYRSGALPPNDKACRCCVAGAPSAGGHAHVSWCSTEDIDGAAAVSLDGCPIPLRFQTT